MHEVRVRHAMARDFPVLQGIERAAGERFREYGLDDVADDEPPSLERLATYADDGRAWVAATDSDVPIGYVLVDTIDGAAHVEQVTVGPSFQGRGIGRALIDHVSGWALGQGMAALTLTTFSHVPWNRPLYERLGFRVLPPDEITPGLQELLDAEAGHGLDRLLRVAMRLDL